MEYGIMTVAIFSVMVSMAAFTVASRAKKEIIILRRKLQELETERRISNGSM